MTQLAPRFATDEKGHRRMLADAANAALRGELNNTGQVTCANGTTSTTITDARMGYGRLLVLVPLDAVAAALNWHLSAMTNGSCTIAHAAPSGDAVFGWCVIGSGGEVGI
jgi:hypothetical protein